MVISEKKKEYMRAYRAANKEKEKAYRAANKEKRKEYRKVYQEANKEKIKETVKAYYEANKEKRKAYLKGNKEKIKEYKKAYNEDNKEKVKAIKKANYEANREKIKAKSSAWTKANPEKARFIRKKRNDRILSTPEGKLINSMRSRIHKIIKINQKVKNKHTLELLGCDGKFLKKHIEKQFNTSQKTMGMSWGNYGEWHVDHIIPIDFFIKNHDFNNIEVQKECFNYSNLQPLWAVENIKKGKNFKI